MPKEERIREQESPSMMWESKLLTKEVTKEEKMSVRIESI